MITLIENFVSKKDCKYIIDLIDKNHVRSQVAGTDRTKSTESDFRTSSTCTFSSDDKVVEKLKNKIAAYLDLDIEKGEDLQGQLYEPGQYFKAHTDYFEGDSYYNHC